MSAIEVAGSSQVMAVVESAAGVLRNVVGTIEQATAGDAIHRPGGVQNVGDFLNAQAQFPSANTLPAVQKVGDLLNEYDIARQDVVTSSEAESDVGTTDLQVRLPVGMPAPSPIGRMGRPLTMTRNVLQQVAMLLSIGFSRRQAAAYLGISPGSISNAASRDPELAAELRRAEEISDLQPQLTVMAEARKNWRAAAWYLEFKKKNPTPLSEEEKQELHQAQLADQRRDAELTKQRLLDLESNAEAMYQQSKSRYEGFGVSPSKPSRSPGPREKKVRAK